MSIENVLLRKAGPFNGNGVTNVFSFNFKVFLPTEVLVVITNTDASESVKVYNVDYTVFLNVDQQTSSGGLVTLLSPLPTGRVMTILSNVNNTQLVDFTNPGGFYPVVLNDALDRATIQIQQLSEKLDRTYTKPVNSGTAGLSIGDYLDQAQVSATLAAQHEANAQESEQAARAYATLITSLVGTTIVDSVITSTVQVIERYANLTRTDFTDIYATALDFGTVLPQDFPNEHNATRWINLSSGDSLLTFDFGTVP